MYSRGTGTFCSRILSGEISKLIQEIVAIYNVTPSAVSTWRRKLLGEGRTSKTSTTPEPDKEVILLKKEKLELEAQVQTLKKETYKLQFENDVLKKAAEILEKDQGISLNRLTNRDEAIVIDVLRSRHELKDLLIVLNMAKSSYCYQKTSMRKPDKYAQLRTNIRKTLKSHHNAIDTDVYMRCSLWMERLSLRKW